MNELEILLMEEAAVIEQHENEDSEPTSVLVFLQNLKAANPGKYVSLVINPDGDGYITLDGAPILRVKVEAFVV